MSKNWYPVIDYVKCTECGKCVDFCQNGVYDKKTAPTPKVIYPDGCVEGCRGCSEKCPAGAISYFGDTSVSGDQACCGGDCDCNGCC